jgi:hypothetical protein
MARTKTRNKRKTQDLSHLDEDVYSTWGLMDWICNGYPEGDPRLMRPYMTPDKKGIPIPKGFLDKFPDMPIHKAQEKWQTYLSLLRKTLIKRLPFMKSEYTTLSTKQMRDKCGRFYPYGKKGDRYTKEETVYVYNEFYPLYPFYAVTKVGSNTTGKISDIVFVNQNLIDLLIDTADHEELVVICFGDLTEEMVDNFKWVNIDLQSLSNYIKSTTEKLKSVNKDDEKPYHDRLLRSLRQAKYIKIITEFFGDDKFPLQTIKSKYGRVYYGGLNLQNCYKEVRNAALGDNYQYDLEAAVYAIKLALIEDIYRDKKIDFTGHYTYTKEYVEHKNHIRNKLAQHIRAYPDGLKLVKETITAIGFGARISGGAWLEGTEVHYPAINDIIMNAEDRERFLNDPWVIEFQKEQTKLTREITTHYKNLPGWCDRHIKGLERSTNKAGKYRKTAIMSYLFQSMETLIMEHITKNLDKDNILLTIHDCIICEHPLNGYDLQDMRSELKSISSYLNISNEFNKGWLDIDIMSYEIKHKQFIQQEEQLAKGYVSTVATTDNIPVTKRYHEKVDTIHDGKCYDSYDEGRKHETYDPNNDEYLNDMTLEQRREHFRIVGYNPNVLPDHISKLMKK